jgi:microcystin-dependent protein
MPYTINFTDLIEKGSITIEDNTINQNTDLTFPGKNYTAYGSAISENFLHLLENFANNTQPTKPVQGQLWYDTTVGTEQLKVYDGTSWVPSGGLKRATTAPEAGNSITGDLWVDTDNQQLYLFTGSGWILVGPNYSDGLTTGATPLQVRGQDNIDYSILQIEVNAIPVAIVAADQFSPKAAISGFSTIYPGINLSSANVAGVGVPKFFGVSEKAQNLIVNNVVVPSTSFMRSDIISTTNQQIRIKNDRGLLLGSGNQLTLEIEGETGVISHNTSGSSLDLRVNNAGVTKTVIRVDSTTNVGINNPAPEESLDVTGSVKVSDRLYVNSTLESVSSTTGALVVKGGTGIAGNLNIAGSSTILGSLTTTNISPDGTNTRTIGSALNKYSNVYSTTFTGNLSGNISGSSARAGAADKLSSSTNFSMTGDISANTIVFDGQVGGNSKVFTTSVSNAFISNKQNISTTINTDEFIFNRAEANTGYDTGLYKVSRRNLLKSVPTNPPGVILPYAGLTAPPNWLLCDGSEISQIEYPVLFELFQFTFKSTQDLSDNGVLYFALPDLRGRMTLGLDNMGGTSANVVAGLRASELGNAGGAESAIIEVENLPEHEHDLEVEGTQFYAIYDGAKGPESPQTSIVYDAPTGTGQGQAVATSGGVAGNTGNALDIMNPYLALNYIIYTGNDLL